MGVFGGIESAKFSEGGSYILTGVHRLEVDSCKHIKTKDGIDAFVVEFKILESSNEKHIPGSLASHMIQIKPNTPALGNISQFLQTALSKPGEPVLAAAITEEVVLFATSEKNPLHGYIVRAVGTEIKTKGKGLPFTKIKYFPDFETVPADATA